MVTATATKTAECGMNGGKDAGVNGVVLAPQVEHLVTLINRSSRDERCLSVFTASNRFVDVMREVQLQRSLLGLTGYDVFEALEVSLPF